MALEQNVLEELQARLDKMIDEFYAARQRRIEKRERSFRDPDETRYRYPDAHNDPPATAN